jgi:hypothetical protein
MTTKTVRSRFNHEIGHQVEGCTIVEKRVIIPPDPKERRLGVYDYVVEVPPMAVNATAAKPRRASAAKASAPATDRESFTRASPDEMGSVIRRLPSR